MGRQIYEKNVRELMRDFACTQTSTFTKDDVVAYFAKNYPLVKKQTILLHLTHLSINDYSRVNYGHYRAEDNVFFKNADGTFRNYNEETDRDYLITY